MGVPGGKEEMQTLGVGWGILTITPGSFSWSLKEEGPVSAFTSLQ